MRKYLLTANNIISVLILFLALTPHYANAASSVSCTCATPGISGNGNNQINCTWTQDVINGMMPENVSSFVVYCNDSSKACLQGGTVKVTDTNIYPDASSEDEIQSGDSSQGYQKLEGLLTDASLQGVNCGTPPPTATLPPPPPPPCVSMAADGTCTAVSTAFGNINTTPTDFITTMFSILLSVSGGVALLLIMRAGYKIMVSTGNPEKIKGAREELVAAIVGLIFIIFSFIILEVIGVDILKIPGFTH